jgi:hypothetical protein
MGPLNPPPVLHSLAPQVGYERNEEVREGEVTVNNRRCRQHRFPSHQLFR